MLGGSSPFFIVHLDARSFFFLLFLPFLRTSSAPFLLLNFLVFLAFPRIRSGLPSTRIDTRQFLRSRLESKFPRVSPRSHVHPHKHPYLCTHLESTSICINSSNMKVRDTNNNTNSHGERKCRKAQGVVS